VEMERRWVEVAMDGDAWEEGKRRCRKNLKKRRRELRLGNKSSGHLRTESEEHQHYHCGYCSCTFRMQFNLYSPSSPTVICVAAAVWSFRWVLAVIY
jgi:hypothetical protein